MLVATWKTFKKSIMWPTCNRWLVCWPSHAILQMLLHLDLGNKKRTHYWHTHLVSNPCYYAYNHSHHHHHQSRSAWHHQGTQKPKHQLTSSPSPRHGTEDTARHIWHPASHNRCHTPTGTSTSEGVHNRLIVPSCYQPTDHWHWWHNTNLVLCHFIMVSSS